jgi:hypothetical protein
MDGDWYRAVLEEYKSLRSEAVTARDAQLSVLRLGVAVIAALIGLGVSLRAESFVGGVLLALVLPVMTALTFELWIGEIRRTVRAGAVVAAIEMRLGEHFKGGSFGPPMGWESWLRRRSKGDSWPFTVAKSQQEHDSVVLALVISGFLFVVSLGSCGLGIHFLWHEKYVPATYVTAAVLGVGHILLAVRAYYAVHGIRLRDVPPEPASVWRFDD